MLQPVDIVEAWPAIAPAAERWLTDKTEAGPENLRLACLTGKARCLQCADGYLVAFIRVNPETSELELIVRWANTVSDELGAFERVKPEVMEAARHMRCARVLFFSSRTGWLRKAVKAGFRVRNIEFAMEVSP